MSVCLFLTCQREDALRLHSLACLIHKYVCEMSWGNASRHQPTESIGIKRTVNITLSEIIAKKCNEFVVISLTQTCYNSKNNSDSFSYRPAVSNVVTTILYCIRLSVLGNTKLSPSRLQHPCSNEKDRNNHLNPFTTRSSALPSTGLRQVWSGLVGSRVRSVGI